MADTTITIASDGTPSPERVQVGPGDTVTFRADGADVVLCVLPETFFGEGRYAIPDGESTSLTVQPGNESGTFDFMTQVGDLTADCKGRRDKRMGGLGGGP